MTAPEVKAPVNMRTRLPKAQRAWWIFQRVSGVVLVVLIFTHLIINLMTGDGVSQIDFAFVAGKWASPLWQWWDFAMLTLAMLHGFNGMRYIISDYAQRPAVRGVLHALLGLSTVVIIVLGTLVIFTFDPCPIDADPSLLPTFCEDVR